ncbi:MAG: aldehyde dehydrogenase [Oligoflexia bacterium]|nr:aldehyde dehydrogenase [Oligoflexia bacterium]
MEIKNFINGHYQEAKSKKTIPLYEPATAKIVGQIAASNKSDVDEAVQAAKAIYPWWSARTPEQRSQALFKIAERLEQSLEELARAESKDQGKPYHLAKEIEIPRAIANFRYFASLILHTQESARPKADASALSYTFRKPIGVAGLISPWNLPLYLLTWKIAPAIAAGNTVVCKPSEITPVTAYLLGDLLNEAGLPHGVVNILFGLGSEVGQAIAEHPEIPLISFTGGTSTGKKILEASVPKIKKTSLELGGKNAALIFSDSDLSEAAIQSVRSSFQNQGEICLCSSRIYVQEEVLEKFLEKFVRTVSLLKIGDPEAKETQMGALVSKEHREKIESYVALAVKDGGTILCGGSRPKLESPFSDGYFYQPTVITGLPKNSRVLREEIFGPVVTVSSFKTEEEAIELANDSEYGLSATVWTKDLSRAHRVAQKLNVGTTWVNSWMVRDLSMPFGGLKQSGLGKEGGEYSLEFFTDTKTICIKI